MDNSMRPAPISAANSEFAAFTFQKRFPFIISQIKDNNTLHPEQGKELDKLTTDLQNGTVSLEKGNFSTADWPYWEQFVHTYAGTPYREIPFYDAEAHAYYRINSIMAFKTDPFEKLKTEGVDNSREFVEALAQNHLEEAFTFGEPHFTYLLYNVLWANSADLSQLDANDVLQNSTLRGRLVIDDIHAVYERLNGLGATHLDFVADNAGIELIADFFLIDYLLHTKTIQQVNLHLKHYPIFVSDATVADVWQHLNLMDGFGSEAVSQFTARLRDHIRNGKLALHSHPFWNSPCHFTLLPKDIKQHFHPATTLLFKGDANYRRLFEDRRWPHATPVADVLDYLGFPSVSIRTLKSEIVLGISKEKTDALFEEDKDWLTNGRYGLVMLTA